MFRLFRRLAVESRKDDPVVSSNQPTPTQTTAGVSRRAFLTGAGASLAAVTVAGCANSSTTPTAQAASLMGDEIVAFDGEHQAGIATSPQAHLAAVAFNLKSEVTAKQLRQLLKLWTQDARRLCSGQNPVASLEPEMVSAPANLTITCGLGAPVFERLLTNVPKPAGLHPLPAFSRDQLDPAYGQTDLLIQLCCDDPVTLAFAQRHLIRSAVDYASVVWVQQGFLNANGAIAKGETPRNMFGVKDGTVNPQTTTDYDNIVWISDGPDYTLGGSMMVVRRIAMNMDTWEELDRTSREVAFGRKLDSGAPLTGEHEFDQADFTKVDADGLPVIDPASHMARATNPADKPFQKIRRRAYNYDLPPVPGSEQTANTGLVFICYQKDPDLQFTPIQQRLDQLDRINQWTTHIGSAVYFCPPGTKTASEFWGEALFQAAGV